MSRFLSVVVVWLLSHTATAQNRFPAIDKSSMDISYHPTNYPILKIQNKTNTPPMARVVYSRPLKNNRAIFGELVEYGKIWRLGANEATEIEFFRNVSLAGKEIEPGRYTMYCYPHENRWTLRLNTGLYGWGLHADSTLDILSAEVPVTKSNEPLEEFTMVFVPASRGMELLIAWDSVQVRLPIEFTSP